MKQSSINVFFLDSRSKRIIECDPSFLLFWYGSFLWNMTFPNRRASISKKLKNEDCFKKNYFCSSPDSTTGRKPREECVAVYSCSNLFWTWVPKLFCHDVSLSDSPKSWDKSPKIEGSEVFSFRCFQRKFKWFDFTKKIVLVLVYRTKQ